MKMRRVVELADMINPMYEGVIKRRGVVSSNVEWIGWPSKGEPTMIVEFQGGTRYAYVGVSRQRAVAACHASSVGEYLNKRIKPQYEALRLA